MEYILDKNRVGKRWLLLINALLAIAQEVANLKSVISDLRNKIV